jgi:hypothetical protein
MGCWSVSCGISNLSIVAGQKCVVLPIRRELSINPLYDPKWVAATLPIYGTYDDYGGIEDIEENENTKLIEKHFNVPIHDFVYFFTRGCISIEDTLQVLQDNKEIKDWSFMFIEREFFDFMCSHNYDDYDASRYDDIKLKLLGFKPLGDNQYEKQGKIFTLKDGRYLLLGSKRIMGVNSSEDDNPSLPSLTNLVDLTPEETYIAKSHKYQLWRHYYDKDRKCFIGEEKTDYIVGEDDAQYFKETLLECVGISCWTIRDYVRYPDDILSGLKKNYIKDMVIYGDELSKLTKLRQNLREMSGSFRPHELYVTEQSGSHDNHQVILEKIVEINKQYIGDW